MALTDAVVAVWSMAPPKWKLVVGGLLGLFLYRVLRFLYTGVVTRLKIRKLQAQGYGVPAPHSLLLGHLGLVRKLGARLPADASYVFSTRDFVTTWRKHSAPPGSFTSSSAEEAVSSAAAAAAAAAAPQVVYLDLWPVAPAPIAIVKDAGLAARLTAARHPPRHAQSKYLARAVAGSDRNLFGWDAAEHHLWRARLNPGFSSRSLQAHVARGRIVAEARVFVERMKRSAGADGSWGAPFRVLPRAVDLTFDIICGVVLNFSPGEQVSGPTEMQTVFRTLCTRHLMYPGMMMLRRLNPFWHLEAYRCHRTLRRILLPHIMNILHAPRLQSKDSSTPKTVVGLALREMQQESLSPKFEADFIEDVIGLTKQFIFAGHDTTAITLSFALHFLSRSKEALQKMRDEHDEVFGKDPSKVDDLLRESPRLLGQLPHTTAAVKETLRLIAVASSMRQAAPDFVLSDPKTGTQYPTEHDFILLSGVRSFHRDPDIWPRPTEFLPQRWVVGDDDPLHAPREGHVWRPFELGPMACIGQELAMMELKMALLFMVREVEFEDALEEWDVMHGRMEPRPTIEGDSIYQSNASALGPPVEGLPMRVRLRPRTWEE